MTIPLFLTVLFIVTHEQSIEFLFLLKVVGAFEVGDDVFGGFVCCHIETGHGGVRGGIGRTEDVMVDFAVRE